MAAGALKWDELGHRLYETGDKNVALYVYDTSGITGTYETPYPQGVAWSGVTAITESPSGADATDLWADDIKYATMRSTEQLGGTIEAYMYPDEWMECDGSKAIAAGVNVGMQTRKQFGLAYITTVGNDTELNDHGEKLHLIYGATANPSQRSYSTINDSPEAITFSWEFTTNPVEVGEGYKPTSIITIDSTKVNAALYAAFKLKIYGDPSTQAHLPLPAQVLSYFGTNVQYVYTEVSSEPDDWDTTYVNYYTRSGTVGAYTYTAVPVQTTAPDFDTTGPYYKRSISS